MIARHLEIAGRVQGVGYRDWLRNEAKLRGISGWVRNRENGTVEAVVAGEAEAVAQIIEACRNGPRWARVDEIVQAEAAPPDQLGFQKLPTV